MDADIFIPLIIFAFIFMTLRMILLHRRETLARKLEARAPVSESGSLRTSELKALIREAVEEAVAHARVVLARLVVIGHVIGKAGIL